MYRYFFYASVICLIPFLSYILIKDILTMARHPATVLTGYFAVTFALLALFIRLVRKVRKERP